MAQPKTPTQHHDLAADLLETAREQALRGSFASSERVAARATAHALLAISGQLLVNSAPARVVLGAPPEGWE